MSALITLTTDFGDDSPYVAAMKGVILSINPDARLVDLSHQIAPQDLQHAAFFLAHSIPYFPADTIHLVVVDPGVGTERPLLYVETSALRIVVPDNGCWTWTVAHDEPSLTVRRLASSQFWRSLVSATFHGRDVLAPVAAHLSLGVSGDALGPQVSEHVRLVEPQPTVTDQGIRGEVLFVDHFGNLITNVPGELIRARQIAEIQVAGHEIPRLLRTYGEASPGSLLALVSSAGTLEIAVNQGSAAERLQAASGAFVQLTCV